MGNSHDRRYIKRHQVTPATPIPVVVKTQPKEAVEQYSKSDKLAIALTLISIAAAIALFLVEKTPLTVSVLLALMGVVLIYPVIHFVRVRRWQVAAFVGLAIGIAAFGKLVWPSQKRLAEAQQVPQITSTEQKRDEPKSEASSETKQPIKTTIKQRRVITRNLLGKWSASHPNASAEETEKWLNEQLEKQGMDFRVQASRRQTPPVFRADHDSTIEIENAVITGNFDQLAFVDHGSKIKVGKDAIINKQATPPQPK